MSDWKQSQGDLIRSPEWLPDGRIRVVVERMYVLPDEINNTYLPALGSAIWNYNVLTGNRSAYATLVLVGAEASTSTGSNTRGRPVVLLIFETLPSTPTEFGLPVARALSGLFKNLTLAGSITSGTAVLTLTTGTTAGLLAGQSLTITGVAGTKVILTVDSTTQVTLTTNAGATVTAAAVTVYKAAPAMEYRHRYLVKGDGSAASLRVALNAPYYTVLPAATAQRYFCGQTVQTAEDGGTVRSIITRVYCELPDTVSRTEQAVFTRPGSLYDVTTHRFRPPQTGLWTITATEYFSLGPPTRTALTYAPTAWATIHYYGMLVGDNVESHIYETKEGYLADGYDVGTDYTGGDLVTLGGRAYDTTTIAAGFHSESTPSTTPTGTKIYSSEPDKAPLFGDIWRKVDLSIDFAQFL